MRLGIDFGTTNSSIALYDGSSLFPVRLDPGSDTPYVLPSLVYIDRAHRATLGTAAAREYLRHETGRPVRWEKRYVGDVEVVVGGGGGGPIVYDHAMIVTVDTGANGRLLQSVKTALRDAEYDGTEIFDRYYTLDELIAIVLAGLKSRAEQQLGGACTSVVIGRPVRFSDDPSVTARAEETLYKAARLAGFSEIRFQLEPIGAAYLYAVSRAERAIALVFDFGGGTLDLTLSELGGDRPPEILATGGVLLGGDDLDRRIMRRLMRHFGTESLLRGGQTFPYEIVNLLRDWQTMPELSRPGYRAMIDELEDSSTNPEAIRALRTLVSRNLGFTLFQEIERTKKELSDEWIGRLEFAHDGIDIHEVLTRVAFEELIAEDVSRAEGGVLEVVAEAGLSTGDVDVVLRTGGSSLIPAFIGMLEGLFGREKVREMDPLSSVVGGLAIAAYQDAGWRPTYANRYLSAGNPIVSRILARSQRACESAELRVGSRCYADNPTFVITRVPLDLAGLPMIRTVAADREAPWRTFLRFFVGRPARVYVAYEASAESIPGWLRAFDLEDMVIHVVQDEVLIEFAVYGRVFGPGKVMLGGNRGPGYRGRPNANYFVVIKSLFGQREEQVTI
jgi:hypothetical chaperone protein